MKVVRFEKGVRIMRPNRISFENLVYQNKQKLLQDSNALDRIDKQIDDKYTKNSKTDSLVN